mmetsp:Transcript_9209/g.27923  ORF Transcript_9209/g.27923 Transcript_9209/m.27923 type:complete len:321 (-) Transcript_9209:85-1047(-)
MDGVERVLRELSNAEFNYNHTAKTVREYDGISVETDYHQTKEHFSKLKFNFIELETKKEFLVRTSQMRPEDVVEVPSGPTEAKAQLKEIKAQNAEARAALEENCAKFSAEHAEVMEMIEAQTKRVAAIRDKEAAVQAMQATVDAQRATIGGDPAEYGHAAELYAKAKREREQEERLLARAQQSHDATAAELERLKAALAAATADRDETKARFDACKSEELRRGREQVGQIEWYKDMTQCLAELGSMSVISATVDSLQVRVNRPAGVVDVVLTFDVISGEPTSVQMHGAVSKCVQQRAIDMIAKGESGERILKTIGADLLL